MGYSFAASSRGAALLRLFWYSSSVSSCSCKFPLGFSVIPPPLRSCALAANHACTFLLCPAQHTIAGAHTESKAQPLHTSKHKNSHTDMWPGMFFSFWNVACLFLLESIWRATQQKLVLFSSPHSTFNTPSDSFGIICTRCFVMGQGIRKELKMATRNTWLQQAKIKSLG